MSTRVKGAVLLARSGFVRGRFGDAEWQRVLARTSDSTRRQIGRAILSASWYPFAVSQEVDQAILDVLGRGDRNVFVEMGAWSARENLTGAHRAFLAPGDPQRFLSRTDAVYRSYYDQGHREYEVTGPTSGVLTTYDAETFSAADCLTVVGWYQEALAMCGAQDVEVVETTCRANGAPYCRYELRWR
jgi:uncharacterized protein (TIGR02265 family)